MCASAEQETIVVRLAHGDKLIGPVAVHNANGTHGHRSWGFSSGVRTDRRSVEALARRGVIAIEHGADGSRSARLRNPAHPFGE